MGLARGEGVTDVVGNSATEDDDVEERIGAETVGSVDGDGGSFTGSIEARNDDVVSVLVDGEHLTSVLGGNTTHWKGMLVILKDMVKGKIRTVVVDGGENGNRLLGDIDAREDGSGLRDTGETLMEDLSREMAELEVDVILLGADTASLADFDGHRTGDDVTGGEILSGGGVALHETFTLGVDEVSSLSTGT